MPDESCRRCGGLLLEYTVCGKCRAPTQFICRICAQKTIERVHDGLCFRPDNGLNKNANMKLSWSSKRIDQIQKKNVTKI
ncbi:MAG: hypothetical protein ACE5RJ_02660 [Nitrosopumilaceae archaeon]